MFDIILTCLVPTNVRVIIFINTNKLHVSFSAKVVLIGPRRAVVF